MRMKKMGHLRMGIKVAMLALVLVGCSEKKKDGAATAKLQFANANIVAMDWKSRAKRWFVPDAYAATLGSPTSFKMKVISAHLSEDVDPNTQDNVGEVSMIYLNPECLEDTMRCNVNDGIADDGLPYTNIIQNFFDFTQGTDAVNAALNAQNREIKPGIYRYVRIDFCKGGTNGIPNAAWSGGNVAVEKPYATGMCGVTSVEMDPPLEVLEGEVVTIYLAYDYSVSIQTGADAQGWDCDGVDATRTCFSVPNFVPAAFKL